MFFFSLSCVPYSCIFFSFFSISFNCEILLLFFSLATISPLYLFFLRFQRLITFFFVPRHDLFHFQSSFSTTISFLSLFPDRSSLYTRAKSGQRILPLLILPHLFTFHPFYHPLHFPFPTRSGKREIEQIFNPRKNSPMPVTRFVKIQPGEHVPRFKKETDIFSSNRVEPSLFENSFHRPASLVQIAIKSAGQFWPATRNCFVLIDRWDRWATAQLPSKRPA